MSDLLHACTGCGAARRLLVRIDADTWLCPRCWRAEGEPAPRGRVSPTDVLAAENAARDHMLARGGKDRYVVRSGKS